MVKSDNIFTTSRSIIVIHTTERSKRGKEGKNRKRERERAEKIKLSNGP